MIYGTSTNSFPDDAYGVDTDLPETPYEIFDNALNRQCEDAIKAGFQDWLEETAREYFDTWNWDSDWWSDWKTKVWEII